MLKVIIVDEIRILGNSLARFIEKDTEIKVIGYASDGNQAIELCRTLDFDILLIDVRLNNCNGIRTICSIKNEFPEVKVVVFTTGIDREEALLCIKYGVEGYILKGIDPDDLVAVLKNAGKGIYSFHKDLIKIVSSAIISEGTEQNYFNNLHLYNDNLTYKEIRIIQMIVTGITEKEIASKLEIEHSKLKVIKKALYNKLKIQNTTQLALYAAKNYLV
ncbi:MAG: response regulator transcription factor [Bacillota bacterium]|nr:response regulator transcription factor [Bacillota bacterium]